MAISKRTWILAAGLFLGPACSGVVGQEPAPAEPVPPPRVFPADAPPKPPVVVCNDGQISISAANSTLASILTELRKCMGTRLDLPPGAGDKRVFDQLGPGPAGDVLASLLSDSGYDFVIGISRTDSSKIDTVILMARSGGASDPGAMAGDHELTPMRRAFLQMRQAAAPHPPGSDGYPARASQDNGGSSKDTAAQPPAAEDKPPAPADAPAAPAALAAEAPATAPPPVASPAIVPAQAAPQGSSAQDPIVNMEQLFEQRRQMIQNQNAAPPHP